MTNEPKIYALLVGSIHGQILHLGIHLSLDEAYAAAKVKMSALGAHRPQDSVNLELWNTLDLSFLFDGVKPPEIPKVIDTIPIIKDISTIEIKSVKSIDDSVKDIKNMRNNLMKKLIEDGDMKQVELVKDILGTNSKRYVIKAIKEKNNILTQSKHDEKSI
jgi:hypothetical protein